MPNPENLEGKGFKKGESGNPNGRPKGSRNRKTIVREALEMMLKREDPLTGKESKKEAQDHMVLAIIAKALSGDVAAFKELMDSGHGKLLDKVEQTNLNSDPLTPDEIKSAKESLDKEI